MYLAMKSGMLAAQAALDALANAEVPAAVLAPYEAAVRSSYIGEDLRKTRNVHQFMAHGRWIGMARVGIQWLTRGRDWADALLGDPDHEGYETLAEHYGTQDPPRPD